MNGFTLEDEEGNAIEDSTDEYYDEADADDYAGDFADDENY